MSLEENRQCLHRALETLDAGDEAEMLALVDEAFAEDYVLHTGGSTPSDPQDVKGLEGYRNHVRTAYQTFGNMQHIVEDEFGDDNRLVTRVRFRAVHKGEFLGIPPTGRLIECTVIYIHHFKDGKIRECWLDWDSLLTVSARLAAASQAQQLGGVQSSVEANKATVLRWMQALNDGDIDALDELAAPDYVYHGPGIELSGSSGLKRFLKAVCAAFPDMKAEIHRMVAEGNLVTTHWTLTGTQQAEFMGVPARGARLQLPFIAISRFRDGKIVEDWELCDTAEMRRQLEAARPAAIA